VQHAASNIFRIIKFISTKHVGPESSGGRVINNNIATEQFKELHKTKTIRCHFILLTIAYLSGGRYQKVYYHLGENK